MADSRSSNGPVPPPLHQEPTQVEKIVVSSALSRPLLLTGPLPDAAPPPPPLQDSYAEALDAVYAQAGMTREAESTSKLSSEQDMPESYTPERVITFLSSLPGHLSMETRYARMEEELHLHQQNDPAELVGEAATELVSLRLELSEQTQELEEASRATRWRIELLESELARMREQFEQAEQEGQEIRQELLVRIDEMTGVIVFFDGYQSYLLNRAQSESYEAPEFPDEATTMRLLDQREAA